MMWRAKKIYLLSEMIEKLDSLVDESFDENTDNIQTVKDLLTQLTDGMELFALRDIMTIVHNSKIIKIHT